MTIHLLQILSLLTPLAATSSDVRDLTEPEKATFRTRAYGPGGPHNPVDEPGTSVTVEAGKSGGAASLALVFQGKDSNPDLKARIEVGHAPNDDGPTDLLTPDGLASGTSLSFSISNLFWHPQSDNEKVAALCSVVVKSDECARNDLPTERRPDYDRTTDMGIPIWAALTLKATYNQLNWVASGTLAPGSTAAVDIGSQFKLGVYADGVGTFAGAFQVKREFKPGPQVQICTPVSGTPGAEQCQTASLDAPTGTFSTALQLEYRRYLSAQFALNPVVDLDLDTRAITARANVYVFPSVDGGLGGGVSLGWRSSDGAVLASVFISERLPFAN